MKSKLTAFSLLVALFMPVTANALCICLDCLWKPKRHFIIQSGHMKPALVSGDCVVFDLVQMPKTAPKRGEIVVFDHPVHQGVSYVSRVIGLPGDTVQMKDGVVWLNKTALKQQTLGLAKEPFVRNAISGSFPRCANTPKLGEICEKDQIKETLPNGVSYIILDISTQRLDNTREYLVPKGHLFFLGDHRDNSVDSRISQNAGGFGFIPIENIIGVLNELP